MWKQLKNIILLNWKNAVTIDVLTLVIFFAVRVAPNWSGLKILAEIHGFWSAKFAGIAWNFFMGTFSSSPVIEIILIALLSILTAINIVVFVVFFRRQRKMLTGRNASLSLSGMVLGLFGAGCVSCGTLLLAPLISLLGLTAFFDKLPFRGAELSIVGIALIVVSIGVMLRKMSQPQICEV